MSKLDTNFVKELYSKNGVELTPEKLNYITTNYSSNDELEFAFNKTYASNSTVQTEVTPEKKNSDVTSVSTLEVPQSESPLQQPQRKATSVGEKPKTTGASVSSAGKGKKVGGKEVKKTSSSEDLISKFGFKDKEEQKKAGVVASKTRVDVKTPSAVKPVSVKEEQFVKPEVKQAQKEASLFKQELKREEEKAFINDFRNATALPENYEQQVIEEVNNEVQGKGVWNTITQGASNVWNKILPYIPGAPSSKEELEQLKSDVTFLPKAKEDYKSILLKQGIKEDEITDDMLTKGAIDLEVKKRIEDKKLSLANDYLDNLDNNIKDRMEFNTLNKIGIKDAEVNRQFNTLKALDLDIKEDNDELVGLEKLARENNGLSQSDLDRYNKLIADLLLKINNRTNLYKNYEKNLSGLTTDKEEYDLFKRSYGFEDKTGKLLNAFADFGLGILQVANVAKGGPMQDLTAMQIATLKNEKDKLVAEKLQKQVENSKNLNDALDYGADVLISQSANISLGYLTGGTSMMFGIGASSAGNKYSELVKSNAEGATDYSKLQMVLASGFYGGSEMLESNTLKMIGSGKRIISKALKNEPSRKIFKESLSNKTLNAGKDFVKNYAGELREEFTTLGAQKITDIVVLDLESKDVFKNAKAEIKSLVKDTGVMVVGLNLFPTSIAKIANAFSPKDYTYNLDRNNKEIEELSKILNNKEASEVVKLEAKNKIDNIVKANEEGLKKIIQNTAKLDDKLIDKVIEIESRNSELRNKANEINEDKSIGKDQKKVLLSGLKDEFVKNEILREDIVSGRKSSFDVLPEEEQTKFKTQAAEAIIQEELNKGVEKDKIQEPNPEVINKKAIEIYESTKQATKQVSEQEIKPATTEAEGVVATQAGTETKPQEEITLTPKTEEDAVQKQITDEGVLQPKQSEMGLQEMEQGDQVDQIIAEQGKKEIVPGSKDVVSGVEITYPTVEQETERKDFRSKTEYVEEASKNLDVEDITVMSKELEGDFGLLTAENPMAKPLTESENVSLNKKAKQWLESRGYKPRRLTGKYTQAENSFFVPNLSKADAVAFAKEFNQDSVAHSEGLIYQDGSMNPRVKADDDFSFSKGYDVNSDNVSVVKTPDGLKTFSVGYDFSQRVQPETSQGREVSKNIDEAKKQVANISDKKIAKSVLNGVKAISKILPNVKVILHDTDDSFRSVSGESKNQESSGLYFNGEIHINLPKANRRTVAHEIFHAILLGKVKTDFNAQKVTKKMIEAIAAKIEGNPKLKAKLEEFASMYDENIQNEEKLAELVGIMAQNYDSFSTRVKEIIKNWLNNLAKSFGVELFESNEVFDVLNTIAKKVASGKEITNKDIVLIENREQGGESEVGTFIFNRKQVNSIKAPSVKNDNRDFIKEFVEDVDLSDFNGRKFVTNMYDYTNAGLTDLGNGFTINMFGGKNYVPLMMSLNDKKLGDVSNLAAFNTKSQAETFIRNSINGGANLFAPHSGTKSESWQFQQHIFSELVNLILDNNILSEKELIDVFNNSINSDKGKKSFNAFKNRLGKDINSFDSFSSNPKKIVELLDINNNFSPDLRKILSNSIPGNKKFKEAIGIKNKDEFFDKITDPLNDGVVGGEIMGIVEFDPNTFEIVKTKEGEIGHHPSFAFSLLAKINGIYQPTNFYKSYDITNEYTKYNKNNTEISKKSEQEKFAQKNVSSSAGSIPKVGKFNETATRQQKVLPSKVAEKLTEDGDGNFVFKHYSDQRRDVIKKGQGTNRITSTEEASALGAVGGLAMFYTMEGQVEPGVGNVEHNILVPMDKVYDIDSDPLGFEKEARKRFNEVRPGQAFTNNHRGAFITKVANENGFDVAVTQWRGSELRAQTTKELTPSEKSIDFKERPLDTFKDGDYAIIDGRESLITNVDGNKLRYESLDGLAKGTTINNEKNRRSIIKIDKPSVRMQKPKKLSTQINKVVGVKPKATEQKRIDKAFGLGIAEQKVLTDDIKAQLNEMVSVAKEALKIEKDRNRVIQKLRQEASKFIKDAISGLKDGDIAKRTINSVISKINSITDANFDDKVVEINQVLDKTYTDRDIKKANSDSKKALDNVMSGKVGKLSEDGSAKDVMSSKIVGFASFVPAIVKRVASGADFQQYLDYLSRLAEKREALSDTDLKTFNKIYDALSGKYNEFVDKVNAIQSKIDNNRPQDINADEKKFFEANKDLFYEYEDPTEVAKKKEERDAKKEEAIAKKKERIKELLPSIKDVFMASNAPKTSFVWRMLSTLSTLDDSDIDAMPENMLSNTENALNSMVFDDVIPTYAENLYKFKLKNDAKKVILETIKRSGKEGLYKYGFFQALGNLKDIVTNPISSFKAILNGTLNEKLIEKRVEAMKLVAIDAALKVYGDTPIYNSIISVLGKGHSYMNSEVLEAEEILSSAKKMLENKSKNLSESYMKITYYLIDQMAKSNQGTTSSIPAIDYFEATINDPKSKIREDKRQLKKLKEFVANIDSFKDKNGDLILTKEEINAANAIRSVLDNNKRNAYEANTYQNGNSSPMINNYFSVTNNTTGQVENDINALNAKFNTASTKAGQLYDKTGTAHPISMNPFSTTISSVKNVSMQFNLRSEILAFSQALEEGIKEAKTDKEISFLSAIKNTLNKQVDILAGSSNFAPPTLLDSFWDSVDKVFYQQALGSFISRSVDFAGNMALLSAVKPNIIFSGSVISRSLNDFYENNNEEGLSKNKILRDFLRNAEASQINKIVSSKDASLERTEFLSKGVDKELLDKGLPSDSEILKTGKKIVKPVDDALSTVNEWVLSFGDVKPYGIGWMGHFASEFKNQTGEDVDAKKISEGDKQYLKQYKEAIRNASNFANRENADMFGSNNQFEKSTEIAYATSGRDTSRGKLSSAINRARFFLTGFTNAALSSINNATNTFVEKSGDRREASKILGGALRMGGYKVAVGALTGLIASAFRSDDDDEEKIKDSFDKLYDDKDFVKNINNMLDITRGKDSEEEIIFTKEEFEEYKKARAELLKNQEFKKAFDIFYGYVNRAMLSDAVIMRTNYVNKQNILFSVSDIKSSFENLKKGYGINDDNIVNILSWLHSERGRSILDPKDREEYISSLEQFLKETNYRYRAADRESLSNLDERITIKLSELLSEYRNKSIEQEITEQGLILLTQLAFARADNFIRGGINYGLELANKSIIEKERGELGYNFYTDQIFNPMFNFGIVNRKEPYKMSDYVSQVAGILNPTLKSLPKPDFDKDHKGLDFLIENESVDLLRYNKTLATFGLNDLKKIHSSLKNDKVYMETSDKFKKNIIREISKDKIDFLRREEMIQKDIEREKQYKSNVIMPKDTTYQRSKFSDFRSKNDKNLKVNSKSIK